MGTMSNENPVLSNEQSLELMSTYSFGRLVVRSEDDIDLFPVNYAIGDGKVYFRTAEGSKLASLTLDNRVLFEADHVDHEVSTAWSVIIKGTARVLEAYDEILAAEDLPLKPWLPTLKYNFVEITPKDISGRQFELGEEPERY